MRTKVACESPATGGGLAGDNFFVATVVRLAYILGMEDFLRYLAKRRGQLQRELADLETAERVYKASGAETIVDRPGLNSSGALDAPGLTIKEACLRVLDEVAPKGLKAAEILTQVKARWKPNLSRAVMAPQLSRLGREMKIRRDKGLWFLVKRTGVSVGTDTPVKVR